MESLFASTIVYWHWWVLALALLILEVFAPGFIFLWLAVAAGIVGLILYFTPDLAWEYQFMAFGVFSVVAVTVWWRWLRRHPISTDEPRLNRRGAQYIGRVFTLATPIVNGYGRIHVDDTYWRIAGVDQPSGTQVEVVAVDGAVLKVRKIA